MPQCSAQRPAHFSVSQCAVKTFSQMKRNFSERNLLLSKYLLLFLVKDSLVWEQNPGMDDEKDLSSQEETLCRAAVC